MIYCSDCLKCVICSLAAGVLIWWCHMAVGICQSG